MARNLGVFPEYTTAATDGHEDELSDDMIVLRALHDEIDRFTTAIAERPVNELNFKLSREAVRATWTAMRAILIDELEPYVRGAAEAYADAAANKEGRMRK